MKTGIHAEYKDTKFICACGNIIESQSTLGGTQKIEICSSCHPFYTGKQKIVDTEGRIEKFKKKYNQE